MTEDSQKNLPKDDDEVLEIPFPEEEEEPAPQENDGPKSETPEVLVKGKEISSIPPTSVATELPNDTKEDDEFVTKAVEMKPAEGFVEADAKPIETPSEGKPTGSERVAQGIADIVFLIDVTGSMQPCIDALKNSILDFIDELTADSDSKPVHDWRARVVGYRDYPADGQTRYGWLVDNPFTSDAQVLKDQLGALVPRGGGVDLSKPADEEPESLLDAMMVVTEAGILEAEEDMAAPDSNKKWRPNGKAVRCIVVFTDAPYHETMSIPGYEGANLQDLFNVIKQKRIVGYMYIPEKDIYKNGFGRFPKFNLTGCGAGADGLSGVVSDPSKLRKILDTLQKGISSSSYLIQL